MLLNGREFNEVYNPSYSNGSVIYYVSIPDSSEIYSNSTNEWLSGEKTVNNCLRTNFLYYVSIKSFSESNVVCEVTLSDSVYSWTLNYVENVTIQNIVFRKYEGTETLLNGTHEILLPKGFVLGKSLYLSNSGVSIKAITTNGYTRSDDTSSLSDGSFVGKDLKIKVLSGKTV
jgi:hypothetical protein